MGLAFVSLAATAVALAATPPPKPVRFDVVYTGGFRYSSQQTWDESCPGANFDQIVRVSTLVTGQKGVRVTPGKTASLAKRGEAHVVGTWSLTGQTGLQDCSTEELVSCEGALDFGRGKTVAAATMSVISLPRSVRIQFDLAALRQEGTGACIPEGDYTAQPYFAAADIAPYYDHVYATMTTAAFKAAAKAKAKVSLKVRGIEPFVPLEGCPGADKSHATCKAFWLPARKITLTFR